jgi:pimeloyl-ACP methyl ester carboxylesterase
VQIEHFDARGSGLKLHCAAAGPIDGPLVILLHGFPDCWVTWRRQLELLGEKGFRAVAPDLRGYGDSDKPRAVRDYAMDRLTADVDELIRSLGRESAHVIGHDWGGHIAWHFAMSYLHRVNKLIILNLPHPQRMKRALLTWRQLKKSWYFFFFQIPLLPESLLKPHRLRKLFSRIAPPEDVEINVRAMRDPHGAIHYYRAGLRYPPPIAKIEAKTLVIFGVDDPWLGEELADPPGDLVPNARVERLTNASHWVHKDKPNEVNALLLDFL